ncbi:hypothetical protein F0562_005416 [Nyssa sinensis]|uniref:Retrovirus-related Pol polyprotein from transposon TNT 1-94-like beta-barrel domain-containing protein n=1 Tax=Nyssa sinensis TaxID=561372 RepID=A0A5J5AJ40_9ASTE|nr:hypothetical protein F0562_005416 [Nyssa sinensis]
MIELVEEEAVELVELFEEEEKEVNYAELEEKEEMLLMSYVELNQSRREDVWFLDSGCSNHMCANKEWFLDLDEEFQQSVKLGNNSKMAVLGKGNIRLQITGVTQSLSSQERAYYANRNVCKQDVHIACKNSAESSHLLPNNSRRQHSPLALQIWASKFQGYENIAI